MRFSHSPQEVNLDALAHLDPKRVLRQNSIFPAEQSIRKLPVGRLQSTNPFECPVQIELRLLCDGRVWEKDVKNEMFVVVR